MIRIAFAISLLYASLAVATADKVGPEHAKRIGADVETILHRTDTPGATIAIAENGRIVYSHAYGLRDREQHFPPTLDTHYEIGSITKQFTAGVILQLQEAGKLHIDDKLATYLPDAPHANEVTLRQLLSHTSGMPEYLDGPDIEQVATKPATFDQLMARIAGKSLDFTPGSRWSYSNTGYVLLGRVIEVVSHESYRHYVQTHLLDPIRMTQTFTVADEAHLPNMATGYRHTDGRIERPLPISETFGWSAGFLVSTVSDLEKWNDALMNGRIVTPADYALMSTSVKTTQQGDAGYGFGLFVDSIDEQPRVGHTGGSLGFTTANEYFPKQGVQIIAFTNNGDNPEPGEMITTAIFEDLYPGIAAAAIRPNPGEDSAVTASLKAVFAQLQSGAENSPQLTAKLNGKMKAGLAKRLAGEFAPYGHPTAFTFRGQRSEANLKWSDYVIRFGPGSLMKFSIGLDSTGKVASLSFG
jgi:D-alanyl-D-alanine carboxypeptidase